MAIKVTPEELEQMASQLEGFASQVDSLAGQLDSAVMNALNAWEGNAQKQYADRYNEFKPVLNQKLPTFIRDMASDAKRRAEGYRQADA